MHPVDANLQQARQLLGTGLPMEVPVADFGGEVSGDLLGGWEGQAGEGVAAEYAAIEANRERLRAAYQQVAEVIAAVNAHSEQARRDLAAVEQGWQHDKESLSDTEVPEGQAGLLEAAQRRIDEAAGLVEQTAGLYQEAAQQIRAAAGVLPPDGGGK